MTILHATCVAIGGRGVVLMGPSGSGKSDLALRLIDRGAMLVGDDGIAIRRDGNILYGSAPATIIGRMEIRGIGITPLPFVAEAPIALAIALDGVVERMPPDALPVRTIEGVDIPLLALAPFEASAPIKVERALSRWGLS